MKFAAVKKSHAGKCENCGSCVPVVMLETAARIGGNAERLYICEQCAADLARQLTEVTS